MAKNELDPKSLLLSNWRELRTELVEWDDCEEGFEGFDGLTRYWCSDAVFEIYWTAERETGCEFYLYLTEDLELAGFNSTLDKQPTLSWKKNLAESIGWQARALAALEELSGTQLDLFKE